MLDSKDIVNKMLGLRPKHPMPLKNKKSMTEYKEALLEGTKAESQEHKNTFKLVQKTKGSLPANKFYGSIAKDHVKELGPDYYEELDEMEWDLRRENRKKKK